MKAISLLALLVSQTLSGQDVKLGTLNLVIEGFRSHEGQLKVSLEKSEADFDTGPVHVSNYRGETLPIAGDKVLVRFVDVPYGTYAIKTFHDANSDAKLNTNLMGVPSEDYGFSNNARGTFGPAKFKDASFQLSAPELNLSIRVK